MQRLISQALDHLKAGYTWCATMRSTLAAPLVVSSPLIMSSRTPKLSMRGELGNLSPLASSRAKLGGPRSCGVLNRGPCGAWGRGEVVRPSVGPCWEVWGPGSRWEALRPLRVGEAGAAGVVAWTGAAVGWARVPALRVEVSLNLAFNVLSPGWIGHLAGGWCSSAARCQDRQGWKRFEHHQTLTDQLIQFYNQII